MTLNDTIQLIIGKHLDWKIQHKNMMVDFWLCPLFTWKINSSALWNVYESILGMLIFKGKWPLIFRRVKLEKISKKYFNNWQELKIHLLRSPASQSFYQHLLLESRSTYLENKQISLKLWSWIDVSHSNE